uniref:Uncharacterized protein n=1 Tax=Pseudictyota dubia TaxID=2749911 RepID=A0A7R9WGV8_9STRA|mmetsp:Transcript_50766/g.93877  ORF Transcript_50766/g.93877 Transcript_50766/m.93877 type:complete len:314 (+) Transcript_50766:350-1291(+)|eukprot:CAMPEP_0197451108 /NCGR_PEP_ID=MMETSP1175-20131217/27748_1 /TAXON_ID=1003142 /ORGANISM="Triceratium dubium, Strain CCMP147" /LENGTH=313 /DNA_ID=CAMNT_0042983723 /DNA_START=347 /DNA_END=1288 /DNA_ORIENTATION=+
MRFTSVVSLCLLAPAAAYVTVAPINAAARSPLFRPQASLKASVVSEPAVVHDFADNVSGKIQKVLEKADDLVISRAMRFVNHAPVIATLAAMIDKLGSTKFGLDIAPSALALQTPAGLGVPGWFGYCLPIMVISQVAAVARSALADNDELSQEDISALAVSNFALTRALTAPSTTNWLIASVASGYYARNGHGSEDANIKNLSIQITSSVSTAAAVLAVAAQLPSVIPFLRGQEEATALLGLLAMLGLSTQDGNGKVKRVVNAAIVGGVLISKIAGGALELSMSNLVSKGIVVTAATAYVAAVAVSRAQDAFA